MILLLQQTQQMQQALTLAHLLLEVVLVLVETYGSAEQYIPAGLLLLLPHLLKIMQLLILLQEPIPQLYL